MPPEVSAAGADTTNALRRALDAANAENTRLRSTVGNVQTQLRERQQGERTAQLAAIDSSISAADTEASTLSERWAALQTEGNFVDASKVLLKMNEAAARSDRLKVQKEWLTNQPQLQQGPAANVVGDLDLAQFNDAERNWISTNQIYATSPEVRARVNDAAMKAIHRDGLVKDSPAYYAVLERAAYPERTAPADAAARPAAAGGGTADAGNAAGDPDAGGDDPMSGGADLDDTQPSVPVSLDRHTRNADPQNRASLDGPAMRIEVNPGAAAADTATPPARVRAAGLEGGASMRAIAAPPSRRVIQASNRAASQHGGVIEPTREEIDTAMALAESIEPDILKRGTEEVVRWYYTLYHSPTHRSTKRRSWVFGNAA